MFRHIWQKADTYGGRVPKDYTKHVHPAVLSVGAAKPRRRRKGEAPYPAARTSEPA